MMVKVLNRLLKSHIKRSAAGEAELHRWRVLTLNRVWPFNYMLGVYLHKFVGDDNRQPHEHISRFLSIGLKGRYKEHVLVDGKEEIVIWKAPWIRTWKQRFHKITLVNPDEPCWTFTAVLINIDDHKMLLARNASLPPEN